MTNSTRVCASGAVCLAVIMSCSDSGGVAPPPQPPTSTAAATVEPPGTDETQRSTQAAIQDIRKRYADIRSRLQSFRKTEREVSGLSTEGGTMEAFFDGNALRLVKATFYGETGRSDREFYYDDSGRPFFVLERESRYEDPPVGAVARAREYRYYFQEGRLIRLLDGERPVPADDANFVARVKAQLELSDQLLKIARRP